MARGLFRSGRCVPGEGLPTRLPLVSYIALSTAYVPGLVLLWILLQVFHHLRVSLWSSPLLTRSFRRRPRQGTPSCSIFLEFPKTLCQTGALGASVCLSSGYHRQTNGQTEHMNQSGDVLRCGTAQHSTAWSTFHWPRGAVLDPPSPQPGQEHTPDILLRSPLTSKAVRHEVGYCPGLLHPSSPRVRQTHRRTASCPHLHVLPSSASIPTPHLHCPFK